MGTAVESSTTSLDPELLRNRDPIFPILLLGEQFNSL